MTEAAATSTYRLPYSVAPRRYELRLAPDLERFIFAGEVSIELEVLEATRTIVLNAIELDLHRATLAAGWDGDERSATPLSIELDEADERVTFVAPDELAPGNYRLACSYTGTLNDKMHGFYRSTYVDTDGVERVLAVTQFQAADARRAFPCFDEPDRKAVFSISIETPPDTSAVSNGPEITSDDLGGGRRLVTFAETPVMATYVVAFVVGRLEASEAVELGGIPVRVVTVAGKSHLHEAAIEASAHALAFYREYFALPYLGQKLDLVAVPDFAFGAMENVGCVTFRESILLADKDNTSRPELERLVEVTEHELAHMWFGDLVTMRWWNGLWLNESFATFMALCCSDDYRPEWNTFTGFARDRASALGIDALHSTRAVEFPARTPADAEAMVDTLTYEKGASVLWMIEAFVGRDAFRNGIRRYLAEHQFSNAETNELWDAIGREAPELPMRSLMDSWIFQGGVPLISATSAQVTSDTTTVTLSQEPFTYLEHPPAGAPSAVGSDWLVPVIVSDGPDLGHESRLVLRQPAELEARLPVLVNAGGSGYFRVAYDERLFAALLGEIDRLSALERYGLAADTWALCVARRAPLARFFALVDHLRDEADPHVLSVVAGAIATLDLVGDSAGRGALAGYASALFAPVLERVGEVRRPGESSDDALVRATATAILGTIGADETVIDRARRRVEADLAGGESLDPDLASASLSVYAAHAGDGELDRLLERLEHPRDPKDESRVRASLAALGDPEVASRVHARCLEGFRAQDVPLLLSAMLRARPLSRATYTFVHAHADELSERLAEYGIRRILEGIVGLAALDASGAETDVAAVRAFWQSRVTGAHARHLAQALERLDAHLAFARAIRAELPGLCSG